MSFKQLFDESQLCLEEGLNLNELGLTRYDLNGKIYFLFEGTEVMYRLLPLTSRKYRKKKLTISEKITNALLKY